MLQDREAMQLRDLVALEQLGLKVRAYEHGLSRRIRWVHTTELADASHYLQGGELILTTGLWRKRRGDEEHFVAILARTGVCGVVYGLPKPNARVPSTLIEACERHELPLLEASFDLPFISISKAVIDQFTDERQAALLSSIRRNDQLVNAMVDGNGSEGVIGVLARHRSLRPWLLAADGAIICSSPPEPSIADCRAAVRAIASAKKLPAEVLFSGETYGTAFPILADRADERYLVVRVREAELATEDRAAIEQALAFLRIESVRLQAVRAVESRFARELLHLIAEGESHAAEIAARLRSFDIDPDRSLVALVALVSEPDSSNLAHTVDVMDAFFALRNTLAVVAAGSDEAVAIFGPPASESDLGALGAELAETLRVKIERVSPIVGIGGRVNGARALRRSLVEAQQAARLGGRSPDSVSVTTYEQLASYKLLLALQEEELRDTFRVALLGPLVEYDERRKTELVQTLDVFLRSSGQWQEAASQLNVHVNTLRYRLARIEELTGRSLDSMESRVDFFLALRAGEQVASRLTLAS
jgi:sugar diacid utilization regulator